jgi:hypothetical protein
MHKTNTTIVTLDASFAPPGDDFNLEPLYPEECNRMPLERPLPRTAALVVASMLFTLGACVLVLGMWLGGGW